MGNGSDFRTRSIISLILIIGISAILLGAVILPILNKPDNDDSPSSIDRDISDGKKSGRYCLSASEAWYNVGRTTCVAFQPAKCVNSKGYWFLNEKTNYKKGFVAFFGKKNMIGESAVKANYCSGSVISVYGEIVTYEGHPEIKVYNLSQVSKATKVHCKSDYYGCVYSK